MPFNEIKWEMSDDKNVPSDFVKVTPGVKDLFIEDASYNPEDSKYSIMVHNVLEPKERFPLNQWLNSLDPETGNIVENGTARGTLHTLGIALAGVDIGVPAPASIVGAVVRADVKLSKPNANGAQFPRVYKFEKSPDDNIVMYSQIDQFLSE